MSHRRWAELLPWYANGTLVDSERRGLETHLEQCEECARELAELRVLRSALITARESAEPSPAGLGRALAEIELYESGRHEARGGWWRRAVDAAQDFWDSAWQPVPTLARAAIAVQLALVVTLGALLLARPGVETGSTTAGASSGTTADAGRIQVAFEPAATEKEIRALLAEINGTIVSGPSAIGLYTIEVPMGERHELERLLRSLRAREGLVRHAERAP